MRLDIAFLGIFFALPAIIGSDVTFGDIKSIKLPQIEYQNILSNQSKGWKKLEANSLITKDSGAKPVLLKTQKMSKNEIVIDYALSRPKFSPSGADHKTDSFFGGVSEIINLDNLPILNKPGKPLLPVIPVSLIISRYHQVDKIEVIAGDPLLLEGKHFIEVSQEHYPLSRPDLIKVTKPDPTVYSRDVKYPGRLYNEVMIQKRRGVQLLHLSINPIAYYPKSKKVGYYNYMRLVIKTSSALDIPLEELRVRQDVKGTKNWGVENPEMLEIGGYLQNPLDTTYDVGGICDPLDSYRYVIVTNQEIQKAETDYTINDLLNSKLAQGVSAKIVLIEDILANYSGRDNAEKLRNFIKDAYNNWETDYITLAGDTNIIPMRKLWVALSSADRDHLPSDLYFQCLDGSYNYDNDNYWGEPNDGIGGGEVDFDPEVYIGRISAENPEEIANYIFKVLAYTDDKRDSPYLKKAMMLGEHLGFGGISEYAKASLEEIRLGSSNHGYTTKGFAADPSIDVGVLYAGNGRWRFDDLHGYLEGGVSIINHLGHGNVRIGLGINNAQAQKLKNNHYFFAYSQACISGAFDQDAIAETFTTSHRSGAFAVIMNSRYGFGVRNSTNGASQNLNRPFWDAYFSKNIERLGELNAYAHTAKNFSIDSPVMRWVVYSSNLLGDPHLRLRAKNPGTQTRPPQIVKLNKAVALDKKVLLEWNKAPRATGFKIKYGKSERNYDNEMDVGLRTEHTVTGLINGMRYCFAAVAYNNKGNSPLSNEICATPKEDAIPPNQKPIANAGMDENALLNSTVNLDGTRSYDPDKDEISFKWSFTKRPDRSAAKLINPTTANPSFIADMEGIFEIKLVVSDQKIDSTPDTVRIAVKKGPSVNIVVNPGFEKGGLYPWKTKNDGALILSTVSNRVRTGKYSIKLVNRSSSNSALVQELTGKIKSDQKYSLSAWMKLTGSSSDYGKIAIMTIDANGSTRYIGTDNKFPLNNTEWTNLNISISVDSNNFGVKQFLCIFTANNKGEFYVDDVALTNYRVASTAFRPLWNP